MVVPNSLKEQLSSGCPGQEAQKLEEGKRKASEGVGRPATCS